MHDACFDEAVKQYIPLHAISIRIDRNGPAREILSLIAYAQSILKRPITDVSSGA